MVGTSLREILSVMRYSKVEVVKSEIGRIMPKPREVAKYWKTIIRSGIVGTFIGAIPGVGEDIAAWVSYDLAKRGAKPEERAKFGHGSVEGLLASETGNNACVPGAIIPVADLGDPRLGTRRGSPRRHVDPRRSPRPPHHGGITHVRVSSDRDGPDRHRGHVRARSHHGAAPGQGAPGSPAEADARRFPPLRGRLLRPPVKALRCLRHDHFRHHRLRSERDGISDGAPRPRHHPGRPPGQEPPQGPHPVEWGHFPFFTAPSSSGSLF